MVEETNQESRPQNRFSGLKKGLSRLFSSFKKKGIEKQADELRAELQAQPSPTKKSFLRRKEQLTPAEREERRKSREAQRKQLNEQLKIERERERQLLKDVRARRREERRKLRTAQARKRNLADYINKAGFPDVNIDRLRKRIFTLTLILTGVFWIAVFIVGALNRKSAVDILIFSVGLWTAIFAFVWLFIWAVIYFWLEMRIYARTKELEEVLPDFLQLASANISAGMPIDRALWLAIRPNFGVLAKEIEDVAKATISGEDLGDSLKKFVARYDSLTLKRSISILLEGLEAGGELADLLNKIAVNIQELKIMRKEMAANVTTYAIFISFASIVVAPVLFGLASQLVTIIIDITSSLDLSGSASSFMSLSLSSDQAIIKDFRIYCMAMMTVTAGMSACIIAVIKKGKVKEGIRNIPIYIIVALIMYFLSSLVLGKVFGGVV